MKTKSKKQKARRGQGQVRDMVIQAFGLSEKDVATTTMGLAGDDVLFAPTVFERIPWHIEVKNKESLGIYKALEQVEKRVGKPDEVPVVFFRRNACPWYVSLRADQFLDMARKYYE